MCKKRQGNKSFKDSRISPDIVNFIAGVYVGDKTVVQIDKEKIIDVEVTSLLPPRHTDNIYNNSGIIIIRL